MALAMSGPGPRIDADYQADRLVAALATATARTALMFMDDLGSRLPTASSSPLTATRPIWKPCCRRIRRRSSTTPCLMKLYGAIARRRKALQPGGVHRHTRKTVIEGNPDPKHISTSYAERQNLTMRMSMRRFTRLTNAFSKKFENHIHALALYFWFYNWARQHKSLGGVSPAMAAGLSDTLLSMSDLVARIDRREFEAKQPQRISIPSN